jgi:hypothetical protein
MVGYFRMPTLDTTPEAAAVQTEIHRRLGATGRFRLAVEMSETVRSFARAGIRFRHPELDEAGVNAALMQQLYGVTPERR